MLTAEKAFAAISGWCSASGGSSLASVGVSVSRDGWLVEHIIASTTWVSRTVSDSDQRVTNPAYYAKPDMADGAIPTLEGH